MHTKLEFQKHSLIYFQGLFHSVQQPDAGDSILVVVVVVVEMLYMNETCIPFHPTSLH